MPISNGQSFRSHKAKKGQTDKATLPVSSLFWWQSTSHRWAQPFLEQCSRGNSRLSPFFNASHSPLQRAFRFPVDFPTGLQHYELAINFRFCEITTHSSANFLPNEKCPTPQPATHYLVRFWLQPYFIISYFKLVNFSHLPCFLSSFMLFAAVENDNNDSDLDLDHSGMWRVG